MFVLRCRRNWLPLLRRRVASLLVSWSKGSLFLPVAGAAGCLSAGFTKDHSIAAPANRALKPRNPNVGRFSETSGDHLGGQNCPSAEENCLDWRLLKRGRFSSRQRKSSASAP